MVVEERINGVLGHDCSTVVRCAKSSSSSDGVGFESGGVKGGDEVLTYKRRKPMRSISETNNPHKDERVSVGAAGQGQSGDKEIKQPHDTDILGRWRNVVLEQILQSLNVNEGGIKNCIQDILASRTFGLSDTLEWRSASEQRTPYQKAGSCHEDRGQDFIGVNSEGSHEKTNNQENVDVSKQLCLNVLHNVMISEKFTLLCKLLCEKFQGSKVENLYDFSIIDSRMREGAYGHSPSLFSTDIQEVWEKLEKIGAEMIYLSKGLSDISRKSYLGQVGGMGNGSCSEGHEDNHPDSIGLFTKRRYTSLGSDQQTRQEQGEVRGSDKARICRCCAAKTGDEDSLVCDSCEEIYHISCIKPAVKEIPQTWYCATCIAIGVESTHENCVVCVRLNDVKTQTCAASKKPIVEEVVRVVEEKSTSSMDCEEPSQGSDGSKNPKTCKLCRGVEENGRIIKECEHQFCPNRFYHEACLTSEQLRKHSSRWYCPSCLCRACLIDQDDNKIVLCDGCDHGYHIHCLKPPLAKIPDGKWFCKECERGIMAIRATKRAYENLKEKQNKKTKKSSEPRNKAVESVDMLLSAAEKLKSEEKVSASLLLRKRNEMKD